MFRGRFDDRNLAEQLSGKIKKVDLLDDAERSDILIDIIYPM
jgi:hypothetical protein